MSIYVLSIKIAFSVLLTIALGILWYSPSLFGNILQKEKGNASNARPIYRRWLALLTVVALQVWMGYALASLFEGTSSAKGGSSGAISSSLLVLFFVGPSTLVTSLFQKINIKIWLIDTLYQILSLTIMGAVMFGLSVKW